MTAQEFTAALWMVSYQAKSVGEQFHKVRQLYEIHEIQNKVLDGTISFPEDSRSSASGISIEFQYALCIFCLRFPDTEEFWFFRAPRNVSFRYPGWETFALRNVSFKIEKGQLCVSPALLTLRVSTHN